MQVHEQQAEFDKRYITSVEVCRRIGVSRSSLVIAQRRGQIPDCLRVDGVNFKFWVRDTLEPHLVDWEARRAAAAQPS